MLKLGVIYSVLLTYCIGNAITQQSGDPGLASLDIGPE